MSAGANTLTRQGVFVRLLGDPILTALSSPAAQLSDIPRGLISELKSRMKLHNGLGMAAPQLGWPLRVIVAQLDRLSVAVMINPEITERSTDMDRQLEGCLSIPGFQATIRRSRSITITYRDEHWAQHELKLVGLSARVVQHEVDHLDGVLIIDGLSAQQKKAAMKCVERARGAS